LATHSHRCQRCGRLLPGSEGRYLMVVSFIADVDMKFEPRPGDTRAEISRALDELELSSEQEAMDQVYQKNVFIVCRSCKEELASDPFNSRRERDEKPVR